LGNFFLLANEWDTKIFLRHSVCFYFLRQNLRINGGITMQTEIREKTIEVRDQLGAEVKRVKEAVVDAVDNGITAAKRAVKQGRRAAEDLVDDAEYKVKQHPFSALGVSLGVGIGLGAAVGVLLARNGRNGRNGK
jgi:ElaB/YqjD/DUF883 family membrane-anchored ribosome-binding protein